MTNLELAQEMMHKACEDCDPNYLRQLREAAGIEVLTLARNACLSVTQVRQLEGEEKGETCFYTPSIKRVAYKRVMKILVSVFKTKKHATISVHNNFGSSS